MFKFLKIVLIILVIIILVWGFSDSYSSHTIDNIVHVVAMGIDKCEDGNENMKVSFQFVNVSSGGSGDSSGGENSTVVTSINTSSLNKAINLMNSYIGKELNFAHCKVLVFSEYFARDGISTEIYTLVNNEEFRPSTNIIISTSTANSYLKNSNPNIEKLVTNYYDTFELTSNFTGYSDDITLGKFYNNLFTSSKANTAILGRTFQKSTESEGSEQGNEQSSSSGNSQGDQSQEQNQEQSSSEGNSQQQQGKGQGQNSSSNNSQSPQNNTQGGENSSKNGTSGQSSGGNESQNDSGGASLEISGQRGTQNVGIAVFKEDKYIGELSEIESICHLLVTNNVDSFVLSIPMDNYPDNILDLNISSVRNSTIKVDTSSDIPNIYVKVYCEAKVLTVDENSNYSNSEVLKDLSKHAHNYIKENIEKYLNKTSKELNSDIANFSQNAIPNFLTLEKWDNYNWASKYENSNFVVDVKLDVTSSLLFSGD